MEINELPDNPKDLRALIKAKEKHYHDAIKNNVDFNKIKAIHESISELKSLLRRIKNKNR